MMMRKVRKVWVCRCRGGERQGEGKVEGGLG